MKQLLHLCFFGLLVFSTIPCLAQEQESVKTSGFYKHGVYAELLGNGLTGSINYERRFYLAYKNLVPSFRVGTLFAWGARDSRSNKRGINLLLPLELSATFGKALFKPEVGLGTTLYYDRFMSYNSNLNTYEIESYVYPFFVFRLGLRYNKPGSRFMARFGLTPIFMPLEKNRELPPFIPSVGLSLGSYLRSKNGK